MLLLDFASSASAVTASEKIQLLILLGSPLRAYVDSKPPKGAKTQSVQNLNNNLR